MSPTAEEITIAEERKALMGLMDKGEYAIPNRKVDENILLATWNIQHFSDKKSDRTIQYIADIVERFDIVALQELKTNLSGFIKLIDFLPGNYKLLVSDPTGNNERLGFLYDKRTVIPTGLVCEISFNVPAKGHTAYQLHRTPYCASFRAGRFDFIITNSHIYYGDSDEDKKERIKEIDLLTDYIVERSKKPNSDVFDKDFFIVGDFNIEKTDDEYYNVLKGKSFALPNEINDLKTNISRNKTFDKISWYPPRSKSFKFTHKANIIPFNNVLYGGDTKTCKKEISDHLPLWAEFKVNELTQELNSIIGKKR